MKTFILNYKKLLKPFNQHPLKFPVILVVDNDNGAKEIFSLLKHNFDVDIDLATKEDFYRITDNLFFIKTPERKDGNESAIEDLFEPELLRFTLNGKSFCRTKNLNSNSEYGKVKFAEEVIRANADKINFQSFGPLLERIVKVIERWERSEANSSQYLA